MFINVCFYLQMPNSINLNWRECFSTQQPLNRAHAARGMTHTPVHSLTANDHAKKNNKLQDFQIDWLKRPKSGSEYGV